MSQYLFREWAVLGLPFIVICTLTKQVPYSTIKTTKRRRPFLMLYSKTAAFILVKRWNKERCDITGNTSRFFDFSY